MRRFDIYFRYIDQYCFIVAGVLAQAEKLTWQNAFRSRESSQSLPPSVSKRILSDRYIKLETTKEDI